VESPGVSQAGRPHRIEGRGDVSLIVQGFLWIFVPAHWTTSATSAGIGNALGQHLALSGLSLLVAAIIALPLGLYIGHTGKGRGIAIVSSNIARAIPTLGLLSILLLYLPDVPFLPAGYTPDIVVFALLAIPPLLAGSYAGLEAIDRQTVDAARAIGMTEWQILTKVEIPLGIALIIGGIRSSSLQIVATVTIAPLFTQVTLGTFIADGLAQADYVKVVAGAILVAALALIIDGLFAIVQRFVVPRGVSRRPTKEKNTTARGTTLAAKPGTPIQEGN
jgi:osmoprotectant transport system permease protein